MTKNLPLRKDESTTTIAAVATPPGRGGVGIVRVSGPRSASIAKKILTKLPKIRQAEYCSFYDKKEKLDSGLALYFKAPHSFTGEDVLELHGHGGPVILDIVLKAVLNAGAVLAKPGEFSERAFLNNKMDLVQCEAVADLINANSIQAAKAAMRSLSGEFSKAISDLLKKLIHLRMYIEAALDFPEEDIDFLAGANVRTMLTEVLEHFDAIYKAAKQGKILSEGVKVVIAGKPNAGKSTLLNRLAGYDAAIVTNIPGTTRDVLRETITLDGLVLKLSDTAGLRETENIVEQMGVERARNEMAQADLVLFVKDASEAQAVQVPQVASPVIVINNKADLTEQKEGLFISAKTGEGIERLIQTIKDTVGFKQAEEGEFVARRRHLEALKKTQTHLQLGKWHLENAVTGELMAEELRLAQQSLCEITGAFTPDDLLGKIFSEFCIGK